jgi:hypothetical protein
MEATVHTKLINLAYAIAWAGAAISGATPASALVETYDSGDYASCSNHDYYTYNESCNGSFGYEQYIRFVSIACSSGDCRGGDITLRAEFVYGAGRKVATPYSSCNDMNLYGLDDCAC